MAHSPKSAAALNLLAELGNGAAQVVGQLLLLGKRGRNTGNQLTDAVLVGVEVKQSADNNRGGSRVHLLEINLNESLHLVVVQVSGELIDEVKAIADVDKRAGILQVHLDEVVLDLLGVVEVVVQADATDLKNGEVRPCSFKVSVKENEHIKLKGEKKKGHKEC